MEKIWFKHYPDSIPKEIELGQEHSLIDLLQKSCQQFADRPAFTQMGVYLSYQDLDDWSQCFAVYLKNQLKLKKGDRFAIMLPNTFQFVVAFWGALRLGLVVTAINPLDTSRELVAQLNDSGAKAIFILDSLLNKVQTVLPQTNLKYVIVTGFADLLPITKRFLIHTFLNIKAIGTQGWVLLKNLKDRFFGKSASFSKYKLSVIKFRTILNSIKAMKTSKQMTRDLNIELNLDDLALLQYTGGTTGTPKGAMLTHRQLLSNVIQSVVWVEPILKAGEERVLVALPLYHIFSLMVCSLAFLRMGGMGILVPDPRQVRSLVRVIQKTKPSVLVGVNTLFEALLKQFTFQKLDFSSLHLTISGGMALQESVAEKWRQVTGCVILEGYGLTEASPIVSINPIHLKKFNGSVGVPVPSTDIAIRDNPMQEKPIGEIGELWVKGPQVMKGYWQQADETHSVLTEDGWLRTGDLACMDSEGLLYIVGRTKEMISVSGFNVYPHEIEQVMASYPGVAEVAVLGIPNKEKGEIVKAFIVKKSSAYLDEEDLLKYCRQNLLPYKVPQLIEWVDALPKSAVGKVLKRKLSRQSNL